MRIAVKNAKQCHCGACLYRNGAWGSDEDKIEALDSGQDFAMMCTGCFEKLAPGDDMVGGVMGPADDESRAELMKAMTEGASND